MKFNLSLKSRRAAEILQGSCGGQFAPPTNELATSGAARATRAHCVHVQGATTFRAQAQKTRAALEESERVRARELEIGEASALKSADFSSGLGLSYYSASGALKCFRAARR